MRVIESLKILLLLLVVAGLAVLFNAPTEQDRTYICRDCISLFHPERVQPGLNLFHSRHLRQANLIDNRGMLIHRWSRPMSKKAIASGRGWHHIEAAPGGRLYAIIRNKSLSLLSWNSDLVWQIDGGYHHDLDLGPGGEVYALHRYYDRVEHNGESYEVLNDAIDTIGTNGDLLSRTSLLTLLSELIPTSLLEKSDRFLKRTGQRRELQGTPADFLHINSLEYLRTPIPGISEEGDFLISIRDINTIAIVSLRDKRLLWSWGHDILGAQHDAAQLSTGRILLFDNRDEREGSRVLEVDPRSGEIIWSYSGGDQNRFFSKSRGSAQRLPNGNTLIGVGNDGTALEVTKEKRLVWNFKNPELRQGKKEGEMEPGVLYRFRRYAPGIIKTYFPKSGTPG